MEFVFRPLPLPCMAHVKHVNLQIVKLSYFLLTRAVRRSKSKCCSKLSPCYCVSLGPFKKVYIWNPVFVKNHYEVLNELFFIFL